MPITVNDINIKRFYINDSNKNSILDLTPDGNINNINNISDISDINNIATLGPTSVSSAINGYSYITTNSTQPDSYSISGPFNVYELNDEITKRINELVTALSIMQRCDRITKYVVSSTPSITITNDPYYFKAAQPSSTPAGYVDFGSDLSACSVFKESITHSGSSNQYTTGAGKVFRGDIYSGSAGSVPSNPGSITKYPTFTSTPFSGQYPTPNSGSIGKNIGQMLGDIDNLLQNYNKIINYFSNNNNYNYGTKNDITTNYNPDTGTYGIGNLRKKFNENLQIRQELDEKVKSILGLPNSYHIESKMHMDSTIYANIMWSILATSLIYFILVKM